MNNMRLEPATSYKDKFFTMRKIALTLLFLLVMSLAANIILSFMLWFEYSGNLIQETQQQIQETQQQIEDLNPSTITPVEISYPVCSKSTVKTWMDYRTITNTSSKQYQLQNSAETTVYGVRSVDGYMLVALGNYYASNSIGKKFRITLSGGDTLLVMVGDIKSDNHTDKNNCYSTHDNAVMEFIVDSKVMDKQAKYHGNFNVVFEGYITHIVEIA